MGARRQSSAQTRVPVVSCESVLSRFLNACVPSVMPGLENEPLCSQSAIPACFREGYFAPDRHSFGASANGDAALSRGKTGAEEESEGILAFIPALSLSSVSSFLNFLGVDTQPDTPFWAVAGLLWMLYSVLDNVDGKQARRLRQCTAGGDFLDHSSDSIVTSLSGLVVMWALLQPASARRPSSSRLLSVSPAPFAAEAYPSHTISLGSLDCLAFILITQLPFFIATWAHPIVGRTILSSSLEGCHWFSVDEVNFLVIPSLLFVRALVPTFWSTALVSLLPHFPAFVHPVVTFLSAAIGIVFQLDSEEVTLGVLLIFASCMLSLVASTRLLVQLVKYDHLPRLLPGVVLFAGSLAFKPPVLLQLGVFSLLCLELIAARLKLHVRTQLYMWWPVALYYFFLFTLHGRDSGAPAGLPEAFASVLGKNYTYHSAAFMTFVLLGICLLSYKHIINRRNGTSQASRKTD
ncbi:putative CDP-alcohol phosphatidyltransferase domain-containing protein [Neospora caninum Liverpool]|uniref:Putative CDP-alcohol phosphatidyltransferase domain-containing protein n=1 Tax=Neospora caninum (strain Liverpool) TaxID=572307 RepID=F0V9R0_NEOCL|nr:putative CDP-alcohol phosphatidyltransferase domain-containing protein [Neospora caninum Liverpool]CBZ50221.1 putative CDP-alcohol phosphatidyltransferase domain-containing protein [Neospora caninum Liverpool]|eukprot:XP_003880256.1 putative CDP-alcohol phosphatidyltransferase domain-containing protein [Neospora caninum Liverpool]